MLLEIARIPVFHVGMNVLLLLALLPPLLLLLLHSEWQGRL